MSRSVDLYFSMLSPWTYIGDAYLNDIVTRHGLVVRYRPVSLAGVFGETGGLPLAKRHPARQNYRWVELQRWRDRRDIPFNLKPKHWPFPVQLADCMVIAATRAGENPARFMSQGMRAIWCEDADLGDIETVRALATGAGLSADTLLEQTQSDAVKVRYEENGKDAIAAGVFGAPTVCLDGELFWGQDRYELLDAALSSEREAYRVPT